MTLTLRKVELHTEKTGDKGWHEATSWWPLIHLFIFIMRTSKNIFLHQSFLQSQEVRKSRANTMVWKGGQSGWFPGNLHASKSKEWNWTERRYNINPMCTYSHLLLKDQPLDPTTEQPHSDIQETQASDHGLHFTSSSPFSISAIALITECTNYFIRILHLMRRINI